MSGKIFISYRRADTEASAGRLYDSLVAEFSAEDIFKDIDSIPLGANFKYAIESKIKDSHIVLVIIGKQFGKIKDKNGKRRLFNPSDFVYLELSSALKMSKVVIPVLVDHAEIPEPEVLPDGLQELVFLNGIKLRHDSWKRDTGKLFNELARLIEIAPWELEVLETGLVNPEVFPQLEKEQVLGSDDIVRSSSSEQDNIEQGQNLDEEELTEEMIEKSVGESDNTELMTIKRVKMHDDLSFFLLIIVLGIVLFISIFLIEEFSVGSTEGNRGSSRLGDTVLVDPIDGSRYKTVQIGNQIWMAENLAATKLNDGTEILNLWASYSWSNTKEPAYSWYNNSELKYRKSYGALYNWYAVESGKLCPQGWHVPKNDEWKELVDYLGGEMVAVEKLKEAGDDHWNDEKKTATNESRFTALPGGFRVSYSFNSEGSSGYWWTATSHSKVSAKSRVIHTNPSIIVEETEQKNYGYSVRCIKD